MHCTMCRTEVETNPMSDLDEATYDLVVAEYTLIHLTGPEDEFDAEGAVVVCERCIKQAKQIAAWTEEQRGETPEGPEDMFPAGIRIIIRHPHSEKILARGVVQGTQDGWYDFGGPESGPGPVEEVTFLTGMTDEGAPFKVFPGDADWDRDES